MRSSHAGGGSRLEDVRPHETSPNPPFYKNVFKRCAAVLNIFFFHVATNPFHLESHVVGLPPREPRNIISFHSVKLPLCPPVYSKWLCPPSWAHVPFCSITLMENSAGGRLGGQGCGAPPSGSLLASAAQPCACRWMARVPHTQPPGPQHGFPVRSQKSKYRSDIQGLHQKP